MLKEKRKPEVMIWYYWEAIHTEALTARHIGAITKEECEKYNEVTRKTQEGKKFTLELREEACQLEFDLEKHRPALKEHYTKLENDFLNS